MQTPHASTAVLEHPVFVAREPIVDRRQQILGYELHLRRQGEETTEQEAARLVHAVHTIGMEAGQRAFVKVSRQLLVDGVPALLPTDHVVIELGADIDGDREVLEACEALRAAEYAISVERRSLDHSAKALLPFANYLKLDVKADAGDARNRARTFTCLSPGMTSLVATGIQTFNQYEAAAAEGFTGFQGFFLGRPTLLPGRQVEGAQVAMLRVLRALNDPNASIAEIEAIVKHDAGLCYRILRSVNSAAAARRTPIESIADALLLVGRDRVRRWASLWILKGINSDAHSELVARSTIRARCCELLASSRLTDDNGSEAFLLGMCSLLDAILNRPMAALVAELPLQEETQRALCGESNPMKDILDCVVAYERAHWRRCEAIAVKAQVNPAVLPGAFAEALRWFHEIV
jgi:EAL and modified HD-GYP domain-containing signal transduction protein